MRMRVRACVPMSVCMRVCMYMCVCVDVMHSAIVSPCVLNVCVCV